MMRRPPRTIGAEHRQCRLDMLATADIYRSHRAATANYVTPQQMKFNGGVINSLAAGMRVNAQNMIVLHFDKRLAVYVRLQVEARRPLPPRPPNRRLTAAEKASERAVKNVVNTDVKRLLRACYRPDDSEFQPDKTELREWLGMKPYPKTIENNVEHFVTKLHDIQQAVEASQAREPTKKGVHGFTLLPCSSSYIPLHMVIDGEGLFGGCARVFQATGNNPLDAPLHTSGNSIDEKEFMRRRSVYMRRAFTVGPFETRLRGSNVSRIEFDSMDANTKAAFASRMFANQVTSNGYSVSVLMSRRASAWELKLQEVEKQQKERRKKRQKPEGLSEQDLEWLALPRDYQPEMMVGVDPGMHSLCTAYCEGANAPPGRVVEISTGEYRHLSGMNDRTFWFENLKKRELQYSDALVRVPSFKTASYTTYLDRLADYWSRVHFLIAFSASHGFLRWRFYVRRMKMKTLDVLAKRIVPFPSPRVLIGYGDWSQQDNLHGHPHVPVKGFRRALKRRATVVAVDEYRTSKLCSECFRPLKNAVLPMHSVSLVMTQTRNVLRCETSTCNARLWSRDVNASRNILHLLQAKLAGANRPEAFRR